MATGDPSGLVFASGQLSLSPTSLAAGTSYPWGGTALGLVKNVVVKPNRRVSWIKEEPFGFEPFDGIDIGEAWVVTGSFRTYDPDFVRKVFASVVTGASSGQPGIQYPNANTYRTGGRLSSLGVPILFTPDDPETQRFWYLYNAVPLTADQQGMPYQRGEEWVVPFQLVGLRDASNRTFAKHLREDFVAGGSTVFP